MSEKFIKTCLEYYKLDPCHYFSLPGLSWDEMLKMTKIKLDLISDIDMHLFIEKGMRGGISYIAERYNKANNQYMWNYDSNEENKFITYWDANNLYGWVMIPLPFSEFDWLSKEEMNKFDPNKIIENNPIGYILEVDLAYPSKLPDMHNDYPLAPEKLEISQNMLSKYCSNIVDEYGIKVDGVNKLVTNLRNKEKYAIRYRNLQLYLSLGMKLTKIDRVLKFRQPNWLKEYIEFNTDKRKNTLNSFGNFF